MRFGVSSTLLFCWIAAFLPLNAARGAERWQKIEGDGFVILTPLKPVAAKRFAGDLELFLQALDDMLEVERSRLAPLTLVVMPHGRALTPYRPRLESGVERDDIDAFFARDASWAVAALDDLRSDDSARALVQHEAVHWYLSGLETRLPLWLEEGFAEVFSTFARKDDQVYWGDLKPGATRFLDGGGRMPLRELLRITHDYSSDGNRQHVGSLYATSWLFLHFLLFGEHDLPRTGINAYVNALRVDPRPDTAIERAFGVDIGTLENAFDTYHRKGRFGLLSKPAPRLAPPRLGTASPEEVQIALGRLALVGRNTKTALEHLAKLRALAPESVAVDELAGQIARTQGDRAGMVEAFRAAMARGSEDAGVYFWLGLHEILPAGADLGHTLSLPLDPLAADVARSGAELLKRSIALHPRWSPSYLALARVVPFLTDARPDDEAPLLAAARRHPDALEVWWALAYHERRSGRLSDGLQRLYQLGDLAAALEQPAQARIARQMAEEWDLDLGFGLLRDALDRRDFAVALHIIQRLEPDLSPARARELAVLRARYEVEVSR